jgi:hypothetical protein
LAFSDEERLQKAVHQVYCTSSVALRSEVMVKNHQHAKQWVLLLVVICLFSLKVTCLISLCTAQAAWIYMFNSLDDS